MSQRYRPQQIIRHRLTGRPLLVVHVYRTCTMVVDSEDSNNPTKVMALLERDYYNWLPDEEMKCEIDIGDVPMQDLKLTFTPKV